MKKSYASPILKEISKMAGLHPEKIAVQDDRTKLTYSQLIIKIDTMVELLASRGVLEGDRLVIPIENSVDYLVSLLGVLASNGTAVLLDPRLPSTDLHRLINHSDPLAILAMKSTMEKLDPELMPGVAVWDLQDHLTPNSKFPTGKALSEHLDKDPDIAIIIYTSGTSGAHKGVMLTQDNIMAGARIMFHVLDGRKDFYCVLPMYHIYCLVCCIFDPLVHGGSIRFITLDNITKVFQSKVPCVAPLVPRMLEYILAKIQTDPTLKAAIEKADTKLIQLSSGGAPLSGGVEKTFESLGLPLTRGYGLSETSGCAAASQPKDGLLGSAGSPAPKMEVKIDRPDDKGVGEILIRGPAVMKGYFRNPQATAEAIVDGWFHSGDLGYFNSAGLLFITGRLKDVIVLPTGEKAMPDNIEAHYSGIEGVKEISVLGLNAKGQVWDEIHAAIVPANKDITLEEIEARIQELSKSLPFHLQIQKVHLVAELPKTSVQKVRRGILRDMIKTETGAKTTVYSITDEPIYNWLRDWLSQTTGVKTSEIDESKALTFYGVDSLNIWQLCEAINQQFHISISPMNVMENSSIIKLAEFCKANQNKDIAASIPPIFVANRSKDLPLSFPEEIHWQRAQYPWQNYLYAVELEGHLNFELLKEAFITLFQRHEIFRTTYQKKGDRLIRHIEPDAKLEMQLFNISQHGQKDQEFQKIIRSYREKTIDIKVLPLVHLAVVKLSDTQFVLIIICARLMADGISLAMMIEDASSYYQDLVDGKTVTFNEALEFQYADYANWQRTLYEQRVFQGEEDYWKKQFQRMALVNLPGKKRTLTKEEQVLKEPLIALGLPIVISPEVTKKLAEIGSGVNSYLQTILAAVLQVSLHIHTKDPRITIRELNAGRKKPYLQRMFGYLNTGLAIVSDFNNDRTFLDLLTAHQKQIHLATMNADIYLEALVGGWGSLIKGSPYYSLNVSYNFLSFHIPNQFGNLKLAVKDLQLEEYLYPPGLELDFVFTHAPDGGVRGGMFYRKVLFDEPSVAPLPNYFVQIATLVAENPEILISEIEEKCNE